MIPKIIHQTWIDHNPPVALNILQQTWLEHHPDWDYHFWTDQDILEFLAEHYSWFLPIYKGYQHSICRVDAFRYFLMHHFGGVYIDLDFEAFRPIDELVIGQELMLSLEPSTHAESTNAPLLISPAWIASIALHPFWLHVQQCLQTPHNYTNPLDITGPFFLTRAYQSYPQMQSITLVASEHLQPLTLNEIEQGELMKIEVRKTITKIAFAAHHWVGTWWKATKDGQDLVVSNLSSFVFDQGKGILEAKFNYNSYKLIDHVSHDQPLISCLMVTKDRFRLAIRSIYCFQKQTYMQKELVIIDDGENSDLQDFVQHLADPMIKYFRLPPSEATLGELRNFSISKATGTYICQWDDDDLCDPLRLDVQISAVQALKVDGCFLNSLYQWWPHQNRLAVSVRRLWECTLLSRKDLFPAYPSLRKGEDTVVLQQIIKGSRLVAIDEPRLYLYGIHQQNTWHQEHFEGHWQHAQVRLEDKTYITALQNLAFRMPIHSYLQSMIYLENN
jgi:mannosyltransferase OCH1-like enzyme